MIPVYPPEGHRYDSPQYDLLWGAAHDLRTPLSLHLATNRFGSGEGDGNRPGGGRIALSPHAYFFVRVSIADMILTGVFERFPKLQVGTVEHELGWVPHFLRRLGRRACVPSAISASHS